MTKVAVPLADVLPGEALSEASALEAALGRPPEAVVRPASAEEIATTLEWAAGQGVGVLPLASGMRVRSAPLDRPFVALRTDRMRGLEIYEPADLTLTARAGTPLAELGARLAAHRQWLPFDPPRVAERSLGGLVATGESGPAWTGYGELRNHVLGMTVVTGDARTLKLGGRVVKNVAGFDLLKPMVGSRGRLAVITSVCVRAFPMPAEDRLLVLRGERAADLAAVGRAVGIAPVLPVSSVVLAPAPSLEAGAALLVRLHGSTPTVEADQRTLERHCGVTFERSADAQAVTAEARDAASEGPVTLVVAVLPSKLPEALRAIEDSIGATGDARQLVADAYLGRVRVAARTLEPGGATRLAEAIQKLDGSLRIRGAAHGEGSGGTSTRIPASADASELIEGLERVFDPGGVLWPCRV